VEDFNSDGIPDLVVTNTDANPSLLTGKGDGTFLAANQLGSGHSNVPIAVADLNGDGRPDLVVPDYATDNVNVLLGFPVTPNLMITMSHVGNFVQGQTGATYTISVSNVGHYATWGQVLVKDTLPTGLTVAAMTGAGWICTVTTMVCSRSDVLAVGGSYPPISVGVNIAADAPASVVNTATVSGQIIRRRHRTRCDIRRSHRSPLRRLIIAAAILSHLKKGRVSHNLPALSDECTRRIPPFPRSSDASVWRKRCGCCAWGLLKDRGHSAPCALHQAAQVGCVL
jgi:uncharacterized repeat protein (TIGR01451 family)